MEGKRLLEGHKSIPKDSEAEMQPVPLMPENRR